MLALRFLLLSVCGSFGNGMCIVSLAPLCLELGVISSCKSPSCRSWLLIWGWFRYCCRVGEAWFRCCGCCVWRRRAPAAAFPGVDRLVLDLLGVALDVKFLHLC
jgi:hypothetical protein